MDFGKEPKPNDVKSEEVGSKSIETERAVDEKAMSKLSIDEIDDELAATENTVHRIDTVDEVS